MHQKLDWNSKSIVTYSLRCNLEGYKRDFLKFSSFVFEREKSMGKVKRAHKTNLKSSLNSVNEAVVVRMNVIQDVFDENEFQGSNFKCMI